MCRNVCQFKGPTVGEGGVHSTQTASFESMTAVASTTCTMCDRVPSHGLLDTILWVQACHNVASTVDIVIPDCRNPAGKRDAPGM